MEGNQSSIPLSPEAAGNLSLVFRKSFSSLPSILPSYLSFPPFLSLFLSRPDNNLRIWLAARALVVQSGKQMREPQGKRRTVNIHPFPPEGSSLRTKC